MFFQAVQQSIPARLSINSLLVQFILFSFFAYSMHIFIGYVLSSTPFNMWRQILAFILIASGVVITLSRAKTDTNGLIFLVSITTASILFLYSLFLGYSLLRVGYAFFAYVGLSSSLIFYGILAEKGKLDIFQRVIFYLMLMACLGLFLDYFTDLFQGIPRAEASNDLEDLSLGHLRRASFFFGASTIVYPFLSFCFITILAYNIKMNSYRIGLFWLLLTLALLVTLSRAAIVAWGILSILVIVTLLARHQSLKKIIAFIFIGNLIYFFLSWALQDLLYQAELIGDRLSDPLNTEDKSNQARLNQWLQGLALFDFSPYVVFGHGLGSTMGQIPDSMPVHTHYESSFFQTMHEGGLFGLLLRYLPAFVAFGYFIRNKWARKQYDLRLHAAWLLVYLFVIFLAPTAGAFHNQLVYFYVCGLLIYKSSPKQRII